MNKTIEKSIFIFVCTVPALILLTIFMIIPTIEVFRMSLYKWGGFSNNKVFVGLDNFKILWNDMNFFRCSSKQYFTDCYCYTLHNVLAILFAAFLTREKMKGNSFSGLFSISRISYSMVVIAGIFSAVYDPNTGLLNNLLALFNLENLQKMWLGDQKIAIFSIGGALIWQAIGYYMVMYMASMASIPESFYEASALEGAGRIRQVFSITLPLIWNNIRTTLTFFIISTINLSFLSGSSDDGRRTRWLDGSIS